MPSLTRWNDAIRPIPIMLSGDGRVEPMEFSTTGVVVTAIVGYLLGSIPVANLVARRRAAIDLRTVGDHNPGYWNAKETLGRRAALPVFVGDVAKGASPRSSEWRSPPGVWGLAYVGTGAAMVGHAFPIFARFRGGRSVLTFVGGAAVFAPIPAGIGVTLLVVFAVTRSFAYGAQAGIVVLPVRPLVVEARTERRRWAC